MKIVWFIGLAIYCIPIFFTGTLQAEVIDSKYPADISFLIVDLKYNEKEGVKICEVQHGILSTFFGDKFTNNKGVIAENFIEVLSQYTTQAWAIGRPSADPELIKEIQNSPNWSVKGNIRQLLADPDFIKRSNLPVHDPCDLYQYHGLLYIKPGKICDLKWLQQNYPGILVMDMPTHPYWIDKYKMSELFNKNPILSKYKPKWGLYPKKYSEDLAKTIIDELKGEIFVIKPRGAFLGKGVIIVSKQNLDGTLKYILTGGTDLSKDEDKSYNYWIKDSFDSFIVEEFIFSDSMAIPHLDNKVYQPTIRIAALLIYHQNQISIEYLGSYWLLPNHSIAEGKTLNEKYKAYCKEPFYEKTDEEAISVVKEQALEALQLLYKEMLISD